MPWEQRGEVEVGGQLERGEAEAADAQLGEGPCRPYPRRACKESGRTSRSTTYAAAGLAWNFDALVRMAAALRAEDAGARSDSLHALRGYGRQGLRRAGASAASVSPLKLPADLNFAAVVHGIDDGGRWRDYSSAVRVSNRFLSQS